MALSNQKNGILAFTKILDHKLAEIAYNFQIAAFIVPEFCLLMNKSFSTNVHWQKWNQFYKQLSGRFLPVTEATESAMKSTPRTTCLVKNFNSRLKNYFFLFCMCLP